MIIGMQIIFLFIALFVAEQFYVAGIHSREHRLLPMILTVMCLYHFYKVVQEISEDQWVFTVLKDLLWIQLIYMLLHYILDFIHKKLPLFMEVLAFLYLLVTDVIIFALYDDPQLYEIVYKIMFSIALSMLLGVASYGYLVNNQSKRQQYICGMMYVALAISGGAIAFVRLGGYNENALVPQAMAISELIIYYMMSRGFIVDTSVLLKEQLYDTSELATILLDTDFYCLDKNQAARDLFGDIEFSYVKELRQLAQGEKEDIVIEKDGKSYKLQLIPEYYRKSLKGYIFYLIDITKQKEETRRMEEQKREAEQLTAFKSRFLAQMSHDLRSPLHAILGVGNLLLEKREISGKNRFLVQHVVQSGNVLLEQVNEILEFSKLEAGKLQLASQPYQLVELLEELGRQCVINLQEKDVRFQMEFTSEHPREVIGDAMRVREVFQNLLSNAAKFTKKGSIQCTISCERKDDSDEVQICFEVRDTGRGIPESVQKDILKEYATYQLDPQMEGTGLGLGIVKQLVELMHGSMEIESDGQTGTRMRVKFWQKMNEQEMEPPICYEREQLLGHNIFHTEIVRPRWIYPNAKILVVDDMKINLDIFKEIVASWKMQVEKATSGKEALEKCKEQEYQAIFMDYLMPGMNGLETATEIRKYSRADIILLSANLTEDICEDAKYYGVTHFVEKPIDMKQLKQVIEEVLPKVYREEPERGTEEFEQGRYQNMREHKALRTYVYEMRPLLRQLEQYRKEDLDLFRAKVHGIKGISKQIQNTRLSEQAEILEMAVRTDNQQFIDSHLPEFLQSLAESIEEIELLNAQWKQQEKIEKAQEEERSHTRNEWIEKAQEGFEKYNLKQIEEALQALERFEFSEEKKKKLQEAQEACEMLEYEKGSQILEGMLEENE